eukprot:1650945-Pyramimonas_sp.AAC.1
MPEKRSIRFRDKEPSSYYQSRSSSAAASSGARAGGVTNCRGGAHGYLLSLKRAGAVGRPSVADR